MSAHATSPRVAVFADGCFLPPRDGMSALRLNMVRHLTKIGIPVVLVHCYREWTDPELFRKEPYSTLLLHPSEFYDVSGAAMRAISAFEPNVIQADYLSILTGPALMASQHFKAALVAEMHYVPSRFFRDQGLKRRELKYVNELLAIVAIVADAVISWTTNDKSILQDEVRIPSSRLYVIRAPIDAPAAAVDYDGGKSIVFLGNLYFHQNVTALQCIRHSILRAIHDLDPEISLTVVGDCPPGLFPPNESRYLRVLGYQDDLTPVWSKALATLAPMSSSNGGVHMKVLTALAAGVPVLGSESAMEGLPAMDGLFVCRSPADYRDVLLSLLRDKALRDSIGQLAWQHIQEHFDSLKSVESLGQMYQEILARQLTRKHMLPKDISDPPVELRETFRNGRFDKNQATDAR